MQVRYLDEKAIANYGSWLKKRWKDANDRRNTADKALANVVASEDVLRTEWADQIAHHAKVPTST